jgi:hypothetical protein
MSREGFMKADIAEIGKKANRRESTCEYILKGTEVLTGPYT